MKCPECGGKGCIQENTINNVQTYPCKACKGTGELQGYAKKAYSGKLTQLRESVKSLKLSRDDLIARATDLQGKLNAMKNEVNQAIDLADFYEKQGLENERLANVFKQALGVLVEFALNTIVSEFPKTLRELASFYREKIPLPNPPLVEDGATDCKCSMPEQVSAEDETAIFEQKGDEADGK